MKTVGLFSGIGGFELPFSTHGVDTCLLCEYWNPARAVLNHRFPGVEVHDDIRTLKRLPSGTELVVGGFPCTDLSQAGRTAGIGGKESGLVAYVFELLARDPVECLVLENVRNMLVLDGGRAMFYLTSTLEGLGYRWAYRLVDSRFTGVPQRRHRVIMVACRDGDPREILFADEASQPDFGSRRYRDDAYGFYWTEGLTGLGWAKDAVPPLKGGSSLGIPSPPAIWLPNNPLLSRFRTPSITAAERLQGFKANWTKPAETVGKTSVRWKLIGNAVSKGVGDWVARRVMSPGAAIIEGQRLVNVSKWPTSAYGESGAIFAYPISQWPEKRRPIHLLEILNKHGSAALAERGARGFLSRVKRSRLRFDPNFLDDLTRYVEVVGKEAPNKVRGKREPLQDSAA